MHTALHTKPNDHGGYIDSRRLDLYERSDINTEHSERSLSCLLASAEPIAECSDPHRLALIQIEYNKRCKEDSCFMKGGELHNRGMLKHCAYLLQQCTAQRETKSRVDESEALEGPLSQDLEQCCMPEASEGAQKAKHADRKQQHEAKAHDEHIGKADPRRSCHMPDHLHLVTVHARRTYAPAPAQAAHPRAAEQWDKAERDRHSTFGSLSLRAWLRTEVAWTSKEV